MGQIVVEDADSADDAEKEEPQEKRRQRMDTRVQMRRLLFFVLVVGWGVIARGEDHFGGDAAVDDNSSRVKAVPVRKSSFLLPFCTKKNPRR